MNIFIDESGSFVSAVKRNSWNSIAAYLSPEIDQKPLRASLAQLRLSSKSGGAGEIKLRDVRETDYFDFLSRLNHLNGVLFTVATDAGVNQIDAVVEHQLVQAEKITEHKDKMLQPAARESLQALSDKVKALSPQLHVQLFCQINLISTILRWGILYFVQRLPKSLGRFRWRIDQKNSIQTEYEKAFSTLTPPILQSIGLREPMPALVGADYRSFDRFNYPAGEEPTYLKDTYGIERRGNGPALNLGKLIHEDLKFEDSKRSEGVQVADLLAAGVRRCLRLQFKDCETAAKLLGQLMVQSRARRPVVLLLGFAETEELVSHEVAHLLNLMKSRSRPMLASKRKPANS